MVILKNLNFLDEKKCSKIIWLGEFVMKSNYIKYYIQQVLYNCSVILINGSVIQTFLMEYGVSGKSVSLYVSLMQIIQVLMMIAVSGIIEKIRNVIKSYSWIAFAKVILLITLMFFSLMNFIKVYVAFISIFAVSIITHVFFGITNVLCYKLPYHIMDINDYGKVTNITGIMIGIGGSLFSAFIMWLTKRFEYFSVMAVLYAFGAVMMFISLILGLNFKACHIHYENKECEKNVNIFRYKPFIVLFIPNLLRGFCAGIFGVAAVIGYHYKILDSSNANALALLLQVSMIVGCLIYSLISKMKKEGIVILIASLGIAISLPTMLIGKSPTIFMLMYFVGNFALNFINYGVPIAVTRIVEYDYIGRYSAWRMMLHTLGAAIGGSSITFMLNTLGGVPTLLIGGVCQVISGLSYYIYMKSLKKII